MTGRIREPLVFRLAVEADFDAIHRLNYQTFVEEIPQHASNADGLLVDRFHSENTYVICKAGERLVAMVCGRCARPFSLDQKVADLDSFLPAHSRAVEIRLLSVVPDYRKTGVLRRVLSLLSSHFLAQGCDLAVISATVRERKLYRHLGFEAFGELTGTAEAAYQPMYLTRAAMERVTFPLFAREST